MEENKSVSDEIEESLRICEELMSRNELDGQLPEKPEFNDWKPLQEEPPMQEEPPQKEEPRQPEIETIPVKSPQKTETAEEAPEEDNVEPKKRGVLRTVISFIICIGIAVAAAVLITRYVANHTTVDGTSMEPALYDGDNLIVEKISYLTGAPQRFDVIVFRHSENTNYIKRIVGLPGEHVRIEEGKIYINEKPIYDSYGDGTMTEAGIAEETITLGSDEYFVLGDNRDGSEDSRDEAVGPVKAEQILGRAWLRVTPFERFGIIENEYRDK